MSSITTIQRDLVDVCRVHRSMRSGVAFDLNAWRVGGTDAGSTLAVIRPPKLVSDKYTGVSVPGRRGVT